MDINQIITSLEQATGPDKVIDFWIGVALFDPSKESVQDLQRDIDLVGIEGMHIDRPFTESVDAAFELGLKLLPDWGFQVGRPSQKYGSHGYYACSFPGDGKIYDDHYINRMTLRDKYCPNAAIALCLAILHGYKDTNGEKP